jgi:hypothetical protein
VIHPDGTAQKFVIAACPFGCAAELTIDRRGSRGRYRRVRCHGCQTLGPLVHYSDEEAVTAWNLRGERMPEPEPLPVYTLTPHSVKSIAAGIAKGVAEMWRGVKGPNGGETVINERSIARKIEAAILGHSKRTLETFATLSARRGEPGEVPGG